MFYQLPPAGNRITFSVDSNVPLPWFLSSDRATFYHSGTAALAAAIIAAKTARAIHDAEVILPAYACPDLLSAAIFARVRPVLVDLEKENWDSLIIV